MRILRPQLMPLAFALGLVVQSAPASAENLVEFLFGGGNQQKSPAQSQPAAQPSFFADPFGLNQPPPAPAKPVARGAAYCVRSCDGRYFPLLARGNSTPVQLCQAFCPAAATKVFYGSNIDGATTAAGERYADSDNAFAYRKALKSECTCNGRDPAGLAPIDVTLDTSLRAGDVVATSNGLVAYSGIRLGSAQTADFAPVSSFPGLTSEVRARLGEMKVAPVNAEMVGEDLAAEAGAAVAAPAPLPQKLSPKAKRASAN